MTRQRKQPPSIDLGALLLAPVTVKSAGQSRTMSPFEAEFEQCVAAGLGRQDLSACTRFIRACIGAGIIAKPEQIDDHEYVIRIPRDWEGESEAFLAMYSKHGPPPWKGPRDGLTAEARAQLSTSRRRKQR